MRNFNFGQNRYLKELFGMKTCVLPHNQSLKVKTRTEFPNILEDNKYHGMSVSGEYLNI